MNEIIDVEINRTGNTTPYNGWDYVAFIKGSEEGYRGYGDSKEEALRALREELEANDITYDCLRYTYE